MSTLKDHKAYRNKGKFEIHFGLNVLNKQEREQLEKYSHWLEALVEGHLDPLNKEQEEFVRCMRTGEIPEGDLQKIWYKYAWRKKEELEHPEKYGLNYQMQEEGFYTREGYKKMRSMMTQEMNKNHKI